ncbi:MAG: NAD(P)-dependent oxidoreductase [Cyclobacteriaceae bacterium]|nr:NAD(P)-dependent oxidoreductase [Cyclobacteriaceae bacterium]
MPEKIGIIGLGRTGMPAAEVFLNAGFTVFGYDKRPEAQKAFENIGGKLAEDSRQLAGNTDTILVMVLNDHQVEDVISGKQGILKNATRRTVIICMSTINRAILEKQAGFCREKGIGFVDCPFTGGPARIPGGNLTLIAAAPEKLLAEVSPVLEKIGKIIHVGSKPGMGQAVKHCNQLLVGVTHAATMEVITMARELGLDASLVSKVISSGIAGSEYFRLLAESVIDKRPSPGGLGQMCKDVSIVVNTAGEINMPAYVARAASKYFTRAEELGMQDREGADLIEIVENTLNNSADPE